MSKLTGVPFTYAANGKSYRGQLVDAPQSPPRAAIVLLPDWRGQSALALDHARFFQHLGCCVVIGDLYGDGFSPTNPDDVGPMVRRLLDNRQEGVSALGACVTALRRSLPAPCPVVCLGYSAGGMVVLDYGRSGADVAGLITCSALLKTADAGMGTRIAAPLLIIQGTEDQVSPMVTIGEVIAEMDATKNDARFLLMSQTHHAFDNPEVGTDTSARLVYSASSAARARAAIESFVREVSDI